MADFEFELKPTGEWPIPHGFTGEIGPFGAVMVVRPRGKSGEESLRQVFLSGPSFPATEFGGGSGVLPSLDGGWLKVDGTLVYMDLKVKGVRKGSRWLEMTFRDRRYTYTSFGFMKQAQLKREGVVVTLDTPSWKKENRGPVRFGKVEGGCGCHGSCHRAGVGRGQQKLPDDEWCPDGHSREGSLRALSG